MMKSINRKLIWVIEFIESKLWYGTITAMIIESSFTRNGSDITHSLADVRGSEGSLCQ